MKLCKDCKHIRVKGRGGWRTNFCKKSILSISVITGRLNYGECEFKNHGYCADWEPNLWYRLFRSK